jgi:predicted nucleic acid-binding protein
VAICYFDNSAVVKRYAQETGTAWVISILDPAADNTIYLARISAVEVVSAFARRQRGNTLSAPDAAKAIADFRTDLANQYRLIELAPTLISRAMILAENQALRGYDAVQLAAALEVNARVTSLNLPSLKLISADAALNTAARTEGLAVDDPNLH